MSMMEGIFELMPSTLGHGIIGLLAHIPRTHLVGVFFFSWSNFAGLVTKRDMIGG